VELRRDVPPPAHLLELQARGRRCVSLLPESGEHDALAGFEFVIHDLCHLGKLTDPEHHAEQVGYFHELRALTRAPRWLEAEATLDATWREDRDRLASDRNGSAGYLFAVLKMRLKMAARRARARAGRMGASTAGGLDEAELRAYAPLEDALCDAMSLRGALREAAARISARRDAEQAAVCLRDHFAEVGRAMLRL
jgi:hypothetical protein